MFSSFPSFLLPYKGRCVITPALPLYISLRCRNIHDGHIGPKRPGRRQFLLPRQLLHLFISAPLSARISVFEEIAQICSGIMPSQKNFSIFYMCRGTKRYFCQCPFRQFCWLTPPLNIPVSRLCVLNLQCRDVCILWFISKRRIACGNATGDILSSEDDSILFDTLRFIRDNNRVIASSEVAKTGTEHPKHISTERNKYNALFIFSASLFR